MSKIVEVPIQIMADKNGESLRIWHQGKRFETVKLSIGMILVNGRQGRNLKWFIVYYLQTRVCGKYTRNKGTVFLLRVPLFH
ncbi:MAG: hypothetical protein ACM3NT_05445 [Methylocystaceae bacterium]